MKFPNKVTPYNKSILPKLPILLTFLREKDYTVTTLYDNVKEKMSVNEYIDALDCLYALGNITMNKEVLHYVERNTI